MELFSHIPKIFIVMLLVGLCGGIIFIDDKLSRRTSILDAFSLLFSNISAFFVLFIMTVLLVYLNFLSQNFSDFWYYLLGNNNLPYLPLLVFVTIGINNILQKGNSFYPSLNKIFTKQHFSLIFKTIFVIFFSIFAIALPVLLIIKLTNNYILGFILAFILLFFIPIMYMFLSVNYKIKDVLKLQHWKLFFKSHKKEYLLGLLKCACFIAFIISVQAIILLNSDGYLQYNLAQHKIMFLKYFDITLLYQALMSTITIPCSFIILSKMNEKMLSNLQDE